MALDPLEHRILLRGIIRLLAEPLGEKEGDFVSAAVKKMNAQSPAPGKAQKRNHIRVVE